VFLSVFACALPAPHAQPPQSPRARALTHVTPTHPLSLTPRPLDLLLAPTGACPARPCPRPYCRPRQRPCPAAAGGGTWRRCCARRPLSQTHHTPHAHTRPYTRSLTRRCVSCGAVRARAGLA
jgi:hypothetical protein